MILATLNNNIKKESYSIEAREGCSQRTFPNKAAPSAPILNDTHLKEKGEEREEREEHRHERNERKTEIVKKRRILTPIL